MKQGSEQSPNTNALEGIACPGCGSTGPFTIVVEAFALVHDSGVAGYREPEWDDSSPITCGACGKSRAVLDFKIEQTTCSECGEPCFETGAGTTHHYGHTSPDSLDHDADGDHVALVDRQCPISAAQHDADGFCQRYGNDCREFTLERATK